MPRTNIRYWNAKLVRNVARDQEQDAQLRTLGWRVFTIWECETKNGDTLLAKIKLIAPHLRPQ
jgi:DNA mismatch endonuclease, patch repair protein